jgi:formylglycine-generating enzyme required for sulfatase activity
MKGAFSLALVAFFVGPPSVDAQPKEPPRNFTNSIGMKFVWIPPGNFLMGSPKEEAERYPREIQHKVTLTKGFYMSVHLVTQEQWQGVMGKNPSHFKGEKNLPVDSVSWEDCQEFLQKLAQIKGQAYRLPTEAEWEYACRANTTTPFHFGETISTDQANYNGNGTYGEGKQGATRRKTTPVASFPSNPWGLYDMHGNVWQWCLDPLGEYPEFAVVDPHRPTHDPARIPEFIVQLSNQGYAQRDAATKALKEMGAIALPALRKAASNGPDLETERRVKRLIEAIAIPEYHVLRGGSFNCLARELRSAHRFRFARTDRYYSIGFRVVASPRDK